MMKPNELSRREALQFLAAIPIEYCGLSALQPVFKQSIDEILTHCAAGVTACWHLRKGKNLAFADQTIAKYVPTLKAITAQGNTQQQKSAADMLAQGLLLKAHLAKHLTSMSALFFTEQRLVSAKHIARSEQFRWYRANVD